MAQEIKLDGYTTGRTLFAVIERSDGQVWNGTAFGVYSFANYATYYSVALTERATATSCYRGDFPVAIVTPGNYTITIRDRSGASPAATDIVAASGTLSWSGSAEVSVWGGQVQQDMSQPVPLSNTAQTVGDALNAARAQAFGKWVLSGTTLTLYGSDNSTVVRTFVLDSPTAPTSRS